MKIAITGAAGALGEAVQIAALEAGHVVFPYRHSDVDIGIMATIERALKRDEPDVLINCAGRIDRTADVSQLLWVNAYGPRMLALACYKRAVHLIHVSTDCVFNGERPMHASEYNGPHGPYPIGAEPDAHYHDLYGATKALGEQMQVPYTGSTIVRTSFVTPRHGLVRWLRGELKAGREVDGYEAVWWSGSSVRYVGQALVEMAQDPPGGIRHLAMAQPITKAGALRIIARAYGLDDSLIRPVWNPVLNRALVPSVVLPRLDGTLTWPA